MHDNNHTHDMADLFSSVERKGVAILYIVTSIILATPYVACIITMIKTKSIIQYSSYKIMVVLGFVDQSLVFFSGILSGAYSLFNVTMTKQSRIPGALANGCYFAYVMLTPTLAVERCVKTWWPNTLWVTLFGGNKLYLAILVSFANGFIHFMVYVLPGWYNAYYDTEIVLWLFNPPDIILTVDMVWTTVTAVILIVSYGMIGIKMRLMQQSMSNSTDTKRELTLLYQCIGTTGTFLFMNIWYYYIGSLIESRWALVFDQWLWIFHSGSNGIIYITFNETIKTELKSAWRKICSKVTPLVTIASAPTAVTPIVHIEGTVAKIGTEVNCSQVIGETANIRPN